VSALLIKTVHSLGAQPVDHHATMTLAKEGDLVLSEENVKYVNTLVLSTRHPQSYLPVLLVAGDIESAGLVVVFRLRDVAENDVIWKILVRYVLALIGVLPVLVGVDWMAPYSVLIVRAMSVYVAHTITE
jgi:hypothetical protein